jgi:hypothetical protein
MTKFRRIRDRRYLRPFVPRRLNRGKTDSKNVRTILEIVGECIALGVLIVMVFQYTLSRKAIEKMAEQNALSTESIARIDSTIQLMHEANELTRESNDLTKQYVGVEAKRTSIEENRFQEELRPRLVINPLRITDIKKDTAVDNYTAWIKISNEGVGEAKDVIVYNTIASSTGILESPRNWVFKSIPPKSPNKDFPKLIPLELPSRSGDLFILTEISYNWVQPSGIKSPYDDHKGHVLYRDLLTNDFVTCGTLDEGDITRVFKKSK